MVGVRTLLPPSDGDEIYFNRPIHEWVTITTPATYHPNSFEYAATVKMLTSVFDAVKDGVEWWQTDIIYQCAVQAFDNFCVSSSNTHPSLHEPSHTRELLGCRVTQTANTYLYPV